jgi:hypothetical protein
LQTRYQLNITFPWISEIPAVPISRSRGQPRPPQRPQAARPKCLPPSTETSENCAKT